MSDDTIRPALTPEEWDELREAFDDEAADGVVIGDGPSQFYDDTGADQSGCLAVIAKNNEAARRHAARAGEPFRGFSWADVDALMKTATEGMDLVAHPDVYEAIAARIAALLPPQNTPPG